MSLPRFLQFIMLGAFIALGACNDGMTPVEVDGPAFAKGGIPGAPPDKGKGGGETTGNNLSYPVVWAEGITKVLRGTFGVVNLGGEFVYWWGAEPEDASNVCAPDPDNTLLCDDGVAGTATGENPFINANLRKAYVQKDALSDWQASTVFATEDVVVDWIDWGDNLESVPWYINSRVRVETVLYDVSATPLVEYLMLHTYGLGIDEVWGLSAVPAGATGTPEVLENYLPTVYSPCARLTIQRLQVDRLDPQLADLSWNGLTGEWEGAGLVLPAVYNDAVYTVQDGPSYYNAEVNVKGRIIYGYTWNVRTLNDGAGDYRITFSLDGVSCNVNTFFVDGTTQIMVPVEEEEIVIAAEPEGEGGLTYLDPEHNLTYIDIRILGTKGGASGPR